MSTTVYEEYTKFDDLSWNRFDLLTFEIQVEDIESPYDIFLNVRHIPEVRYEELNLNFTIFSPGGDMRTTDYTLEFVDRDGNQLSECLGDLCDLQVLLRDGLRFNEKGLAKFEIENKFTKVELPGIIEVGLIVKKSTPAE
jgi:gliding motility-associated lipoprotein GldH